MSIIIIIDDIYKKIKVGLLRKSVWADILVGFILAKNYLLRIIDDDLQSLNFGVHTTWMKARDRD